jgi:hypothetical protein
MAVVVTRSQLASRGGVITEKIQVDWTSDASGDASGTVRLDGFLIKVITDPAAAGSAPSDNYDITLVADGIDMAAGQLVDRDTANNEMVYPVASSACTPIFLAGDHVFTVAAAGNAKSGVAYLYLREA